MYNFFIAFRACVFITAPFFFCCCCCLFLILFLLREARLEKWRSKENIPVAEEFLCPLNSPLLYYLEVDEIIYRLWVYRLGFRAQVQGLSTCGVFYFCVVSCSLPFPFFIFISHLTYGHICILSIFEREPFQVFSTFKFFTVKGMKSHIFLSSCYASLWEHTCRTHLETYHGGNNSEMLIMLMHPFVRWPAFLSFIIHSPSNFWLVINPLLVNIS